MVTKAREALGDTLRSDDRPPEYSSIASDKRDSVSSSAEIKIDGDTFYLETVQTTGDYEYFPIPDELTELVSRFLVPTNIITTKKIIVYLYDKTQLNIIKHVEEMTNKLEHSIAEHLE